MVIIIVIIVIPYKVIFLMVEIDKLLLSVHLTGKIGEFKIILPSKAYHIYPNKSMAHINAWAQINTGVKHSKVNRSYIKCRRAHISTWSKIVYKK